ncbi:MAG TPA: cadherin repeat domain-containing protein, partial [Arcobacter sp.]|nr:cadherin repeat domain-containing protein [Arcobacter sp.]
MKFFSYLVTVSLIFLFTACGGKGNKSEYHTVPSDFIHGYVVDNYIKNATVCIDSNFDNSCSDESSEFRTTSDENGSFRFDIKLTDDMTIIAYGGEDATTGEEFNHLVKNFSINTDKNGKIILSSITTLITEVKNNSSLDLTDSINLVNNFLGGSNQNIEPENIIEDVVANKEFQSDEFLRSLKLFEMASSGTSTLTPDNSIKAFKQLANIIIHNPTIKHDVNSSAYIIEENGENKNLFVEHTTPVFTRVVPQEIISGTKFIADLSTLVINPDGENVRFEVVDTTGTYEIIGSHLYFVDYPIYTSGSTNEYSVTVRAINGSKIKEITFDFSLVDGNDNVPIITMESNYNINENQYEALGVVASDRDNDDLSYSISGIDASYFNINSSTGELTFKVAPDYESKKIYTFLVTVSDGKYDVNKGININIVDINEFAPVITTQTPYSVVENQLSILNIEASDGDTSDNLDYGISGTDASYFNIDITTGAITFKTAPDYETKNSYTIDVSVTDGTNNTIKTFIINVTNVNEFTPVISSGNSVSVNENQISVIDVNATDGDTSENLDYSISGTDANDFNIDTTTGVITFKTAPDYESGKTNYSFDVNVSDGLNDVTQQITVSVQNVNEFTPVIISGNSVSVNENQISVIDVNATDGDTSENLDYGISGTDANDFNIDITTGVITFKTAPDYETKNSYTIDVSVSDGLNDVTQHINVSINNLFDVVPTLNTTELNITENIAIGTKIGDINVSSLGDSNISSYTISNDRYFNIENNGSIRVSGIINYEQFTIHELNVTATNEAGESAIASLIIGVTDVYEVGVPTDINITSDFDNTERDNTALINEDSGDNLFVGTFNSDGGSSGFTFSLVTGTGDSDNGSFDINSSNRLYLLHEANYESGKTSYNIRVQVTDNDSNTKQETFTINVNNINDVATFTSTPVTSLQQGESYSYTATVNDIDLGAQLTETTHTIPNGFSKVSTTGNNTDTINITIEDSGSLGDNMVGNHNFVLNVIEDQTGNTILQSFTVSVIDINDKPYYESNDVSDRIVNLGDTTQYYDVDITDGDGAQSQEITITLSSSNPNVATVPGSLPSVIDSET